MRDWGNAHTAAEHANDRALGLLTFLAADLERSSGLIQPRLSLLAAVHEDVAEVPMEYAFVHPSTAFFRWMQLSALAEQLAEPRLARLIVELVSERLESGVDAAELEALCACRRGRIARMNGDLDVAEAHYQEAARVVRRLPWRDARPRAELGLATLAGARGNYPAVRTIVTRLLAHRPRVHAAHRLVTYQISAIARRKSGDFLGSLLDNWSAFDLCASDDPRRNELVVVMAETALDIGDGAAATRAFASVTLERLPLRLQASVHIGHLRAALLNPHALQGAATGTPSMKRLERQARAVLEQPLGPQDRTRVLLALAEAAVRRESVAEVRDWLDQATALATAHGYHEYLHWIEAIGARGAQIARADLTTASSSATAPAMSPRLPLVDQSIRATAPALARLRALTSV